jgi:hypothetical protein
LDPNPLSYFACPTALNDSEYWAMTTTSDLGADIESTQGLNMYGTVLSKARRRVFRIIRDLMLYVLTPLVDPTEETKQHAPINAVRVFLTAQWWHNQILQYPARFPHLHFERRLPIFDDIEISSRRARPNLQYPGRWDLHNSVNGHLDVSVEVTSCYPRLRPLQRNRFPSVFTTLDIPKRPLQSEWDKRIPVNHHLDLHIPSPNT